MPKILQRFSINFITGKAIKSSPPAETSPLIQGGLVNIFNYGVLITGPGGVGKSELALSLIDRGHRLISDDVTLLQQEGQQVVGRAPDELAGLLQLHGCGFFNVKELVGGERYMVSSPLQLIIHLNPEIQYEANPLEITRTTLTIMDVEIPQLTIPLPTQRNLPLIIELLVRKEIAEK